MSEPVIEGEATEEPGAELVPASVEPQPQVPATLFRTDDPTEVIVRATAVADALSKVLRTQKDSRGKLKLISTISGREHVKVEGWTLCGTMLGVFAVTEWTHKLTDPEGWEARVEARTLDGHVVGSAEAQCTRDEEQWGWHPKGRDGRDLTPRDDFALRSMAQTRATSKALRIPLGFIMELAGFAATPAEEMPESESAQPQGQSEPAQPQASRPAAPQRYPVPRSWPKALEAARECDNPEESEALYEAFLRAAAYHLYGEESLKALTVEQRKVVFQKVAGAVCWLHDTDAGREGPFAFFAEEQWRQAWMQVLDGHRLEIPDYVPPPAETTPVDEEAERLAREALSGEEYQ